MCASEYSGSGAVPWFLLSPCRHPFSICYELYCNHPLQIYPHTCKQFTKTTLYALFQCDQQSSRAEAGGRDPDVITEAHWQHCGHLLRLLHYLWYLGSPGERWGAQKEIMRKQKSQSSYATETVTFS